MTVQPTARASGDRHPCPNCGYCPTCGKANAAPAYPVYPWTTNPYGPFWGQPYPSHFYQPNVFITDITTAVNSLSGSSLAGATYQVQ